MENKSSQIDDAPNVDFDIYRYTHRYFDTLFINGLKEGIRENFHLFSAADVEQYLLTPSVICEILLMTEDEMDKIEKESMARGSNNTQ